MRFRLGFVIMLIACGRNAWAQCEMPAAIRQILSQPIMQRKVVDSQADKDARAVAIKKALVAHPDDYFLLGTQMRDFNDPNEKLRWAQNLRKQHPDKPVYEVIEAEALQGTNTPEAIRLMEALQAAHPELQLFLPIVSAINQGKFQDIPKVQKQLDGYIKGCADSISLDGTFLSIVQQVGTPEHVNWTAAALRKRLESDAAETRTSPWNALWRLEFKQYPPAEHDTVRKKIAEDLARMEKSPRSQELTWMSLLQSGYQSIGDEAAVERLNNEIVKVYPQSAEAKGIVRKQWNDKNPPPKMDDKAAVESYARIHLAIQREWHKRWLDDSYFLYYVFYDLSQLPDTTAEQITAAVDEFFAAYRKNPSWSSTPPFEFRIAEAYVKNAIRLDQVPSLVNDSYRSMVEREGAWLRDDRIADQNQRTYRNRLDYTHLQAAQILLDCYAETKQPQKAKEVLAELASIDASKQPNNWQILSLKAQAAEIDGRKLDALMLYRTALDTLGSNRPNKLSENVQRLWKEMGGTEEGLGVSATKKISESTEGRWERSTGSLPSFSLKDFNGNSWDLKNLRGKALLINVWATWCGPCVAEHPEFQRLYDKLKSRNDIAILSFTIDEDIGKVAPYMAKHKYTFPVLPAADLINGPPQQNLWVHSGSGSAPSV